VPFVPLRVLGGVRLGSVTGEFSAGGPLAERLLGLLVVAEGAPLDHDVITEVLWPDRHPGGSDPPLKMTVSRLRSRLARAGMEHAVEGRRGTYRLAVPAEKIDAEVFVSLTDAARRLAVPAPDRAAALLDGALALWRGEPFGALSAEPWATAYVARLDELRLAAEEELSELDLTRHREEIVVHRLRYLAEREPLRERRWEQLAVALYRLGRQSEGLRAIEQARATLREQLGLDLGAGLQETERALLAHDPSMLVTTTSTRAAVSTPAIVGRDADVVAVERLLEANRLVTVHGLPGVGKSAVARVVAAAVVRRTVLVVELEGLVTGADVWHAVAAATGIAGAEDPADLPAAVAGRLRSHPVLVVLDGADAGIDAVADVVESLLLLVPSVQVLVTSRVPLGAAEEVRYALDPLQIGPSADSAAVRLFCDRAGLVFDQLDDSHRRAVVRICERTGGLPLALELAAGCIDRHGIDGLAAGESSGADALRDALRWALAVVPAASLVLARRVSLLPGGVSAASAARLAEVDQADARRVLAPLLQARLLVAVDGGPAGVRYRLPGSVREVVASDLRPEEEQAAGEVIVAHLLDLAASVGDVDMRPSLAAVPAVEVELANMRHWLVRRLGTEEGLRLAVAMAPTMAEIGLGAEGRRWIEEHRAATPHADDLLLARAALATASVGGFFAGSALQADELRVAEQTAARHGAWRLWLHVRGHLAIARGWSGDGAGALALIQDPEVGERLAELADPVMETHRERLQALGAAVCGDLATARAELGAVAERFLAHGDPGASLQALFVRAWLARSAGDMDGAADDLTRARELATTGAARATQALIAAELAHLAHHRGDPAAPAMLRTAVDALERAGNLRSAAVQRRDLGSWLLADGDRVGGLVVLQAVLPMLLRTDRRGAAVAVAELAAAIAEDRPTDGLRLARAAEGLLLDPFGAAAPEQDARVREVLAALPTGSSGAEADRDLTDEEILTLALGSAAVDD
jgi:DNA-binding SARP family transcriptional activator/predicted ATPase